MSKSDTMKALVGVYKNHIDDELNFGEGKNRLMGISVPFWVVENIAFEFIRKSRRAGPKRKTV